MKWAAPFFTTILVVSGGSRELLGACLSMFVELGIFLVALLKKHFALLSVRKRLLSGKFLLVDDGFYCFVGILGNGILKPAKKLFIRYFTAESGEAANQVIEFVELEGDVGAVAVLKRFKLLECSINIPVRKAIVAVQ